MQREIVCPQIFGVEYDKLHVYLLRNIRCALASCEKTKRMAEVEIAKAVTNSFVAPLIEATKKTN